jgi:hypothetical protein
MLESMKIFLDRWSVLCPKAVSKLMGTESNVGINEYQEKAAPLCTN